MLQKAFSVNINRQDQTKIITLSDCFISLSQHIPKVMDLLIRFKQNDYQNYKNKLYSQHYEHYLFIALKHQNLYDMQLETKELILKQMSFVRYS